MYTRDASSLSTSVANQKPIDVVAPEIVHERRVRVAVLIDQVLEGELL